MSLRTLYVGDIHGDYAALRSVVLAALDRMPSIDRVVQVGDFGYWPRHRQDYSSLLLPVPLFFIDGNHEDHHLLRMRGAELPGPVDEDCPAHWIPRGYVHDGIAYMGGGTSIDRFSRIEGEDWFPTENIGEDEVARTIQQLVASPVKVIVAHETTSGAFHQIRQLGWSPVDRNRDLLEELFLAARPRAYIHGHYHFFREYEYLGCRFFSLANPDAFRRQLDSASEEDATCVLKECSVVVDGEGGVCRF